MGAIIHFVTFKRCIIKLTPQTPSMIPQRKTLDYRSAGSAPPHPTWAIEACTAGIIGALLGITQLDTGFFNDESKFQNLLGIAYLVTTIVGISLSVTALLERDKKKSLAITALILNLGLPLAALTMYILFIFSDP